MNLSPRQRDVLRHLFDGACAKTMARRMGVEISTAKNHQHELYQRLGVRTRGELMARYMQPTEEAMRLLNPTPTHSPRPRAPLCTADSPSRKMGVGMGYSP